MKKIIIATAAAIILVLTATLLITGCFETFNSNPSSPSTTVTPSPTPIPTPTQPPTIIVPDDCPTISSAIANATDDYLIIVKNGTYYEQTLSISKKLTIISQYQNGAQIILNPQEKGHYGPYEYPYESALQINSNDVTLSGFLITVHMPPPNDQTLGDEIGLILVKADGVQILNNNLLDREKTSFIVWGNSSKVVGNSLGSIDLHGYNNLVENNQIAPKSSSNYVSTISLSGSNNTISSNQVIGGRIGIKLQPSYPFEPMNYNVIWNNTIIVNHSRDSIGIKIYVGDADSNTDYNFFGGNTISQAKAYGIYFDHGNYNVFYGNIFKDCNSTAYFAEPIFRKQGPACNNLFFGNSFINNPEKVVVDSKVSPANFFDNGSMGNYWDTYSGTGAFQVYSKDSTYYFDNFPLLESPGALTDFPCLPSHWNKISFTLGNS